MVTQTDFGEEIFQNTFTSQKSGMGRETAKGKGSSKHTPNKKSSKITNPASGAKQRNPANLHKAGDGTEPASQEVVPLHLQQLLLNLFSQSLSTVDDQSTSDISATVQEVKQHLYNRDFVAAFATEERRRAYALRWSASRALGYTEIFVKALTARELASDGGVDDLEASQSTSPADCPRKVLCLGGGGGAELIGMAAMKKISSLKSGSSALDVTIVDVADWKDVIDRLGRAVISPPVLSKYASAAAREKAIPLLDESDFNFRFKQFDLLDQDGGDDWTALLRDVDVVTIMFTLNELYSISRLKTTSFLQSFAENMKSGSRLLVVDSPGSYSTVTFDKSREQQEATSTHTMSLLLDLTLLGENKDETGQWTKSTEDTSRWFRLPQGLKYPVDLENMRYQIHVYHHR